MEKELISYRKFNDMALAQELVEVLKGNNIAYRVEEESTLFNPTFYADETAKDYVVKIMGDDFVRVNELLKAEETGVVEQADSEHYLYDFTDDELKDLIAKPDEWSSFDHLLALKILKERGLTISSQEIAAMNDERLGALRQPDPPQTFWIVLGYIFSLLGGLLGLFIGWHLATHTKTLPNGEKVYGYMEADRAHGKRIQYISIVMIAVWVLGRFI